VTEASDAALLAEVAGESQRAFNRLVDLHQQAVRTFLRGVMRPDEADDIAQETFLALWTHAKSFNGETSVRSWLFSIAWRKAKGAQRRWFRGRRRDTAYREALFVTQVEPMDAADRHALQQALAHLAPEQRAAVMLCFGCGLSHGEASEALNMPLGTVKSHVLRGRARLHEILGGDTHDR
jgi:RNA polymerase sigma-70 factor (ECF subfamily)